MNHKPIVAAGLVVIFTFVALALGCKAAWPEAGGSPASPGMLDPENDNEARLNRLQPPDRVMDAVGVAPGQVVAEIGAGRGRYAVQLAARVGAEGRVYAEDIDAVALKYLRARCDRWNIRNVETVLGEVNDPRLPTDSLDLIFIISSFHHFEDPVTLMRNARKALKRSGKLAIVEWAPRPDREYLTPEQMAATMKRAGFALARTETFLLANGLYIYLFHPDGGDRGSGQNQTQEKAR